MSEQVKAMSTEIDRNRREAHLGRYVRLRARWHIILYETHRIAPRTRHGAS